MPITGMDRMPGAGLARGTLFDKELNVTEIDVPNLTIRGSIILEKSGDANYSITWTSPSSNLIITIPQLGAADQFTFNDATQTLTAKTLTSPAINTATVVGGTITGITDLDMAVGNRTIFDTIAANTLTIGASSTTISIPGNLTISGTTTTVDTTTLQIADNLFLMNRDFSGSATEDAGLVIERGDDTNVAFVWDESADEFALFTTNSTGGGNDISELAYTDLRLATLTAANIDAFTLGGKLTAGSSEIEGSNFDINGGTVDAITSLTVANNVDVGNYTVRANNFLADSHTATRIFFAGTDGVLTSDSDLTFATDTLTATKIGAFEAVGAINFASQNLTNVNIDSGTADALTSLTVANNVDVGNYTVRANNFLADSLTAGRVVFAGTDGALDSDSDLTFATDTLTATKIGAFEAAGAINFATQNMTNVDINSGDISGVTISGGLTWGADQSLSSYNLQTAGKLTITADSAATIDTSGGGVNAAASITLGAGQDGGLYVNSDNLYIENKTSDKDIIFRGNDGGTFKTLMTIDASEATVVLPIVDINGGDISGVTVSGGLTWSAAQNLNSQALTNVNIDSGDISAATISGGLTWSAAQDLNNQALTNANIDTGDIASAVTINKSPTVTLTGDVTASATAMTNLGNVSLATTIAAASVAGAMFDDTVISGQTALTSGLAATDELLISDGGTIKRMDVSVLSPYLAAVSETLTNKTLTTPTIGDMTNATHDHADNAGGGVVPIANTSGTLAVARGGTGATTLNDLITLGTHTTGNYVATITGGTGITSSAATSGEGTTHSLSVDAAQSQITSVGTLTSITTSGDITTTAAVDWDLLDNSASALSFDAAGKSGILEIVTTNGSEKVAMSGDLTVAGNMTVTGTTTQVNTVTMNAQNAVIFEGATADEYETTLTIVDPTADRSVYMPNQSGYLPVLAAASTTQVSSTPAELNLLDGSVANTVVNSKAVIYGSSGEVAGTLSTAAQGTVTSLGTLTALQVDNLNINDNTISTTDTNGTLILAPHGTGDIQLGGNLIFPQASTISTLNGILALDAQATSAIRLNEAGVNTDVYIEGDNNANLFHTNAGTDTVGIGGTGRTESMLSITTGAVGHNLYTQYGTAINVVADTLNDTGSAATDAIIPTVSIAPITYTGTNANTYTDATSLYIEGPPVASTNITITNAYALWVDGGVSRFDGNLTFPQASTITTTGGSSHLTIGTSTAGADFKVDSGNDIILEARAGRDFIVRGDTQYFQNSTANSSMMILNANGMAFQGAATINTTGSDALTITSAAALNLNPAAGSVILLDGAISIDGSVVTGASSITSTAFVGTLSTPAQPNITSLGTLTALTVDAVAIDGKIITMTGSTDDTAIFNVAANGALALYTTDTAGAAANITITADGVAELAGTTVTVNSSGGVTIDADNGTITFADGGSSLGTITSSGFTGNVVGNVVGNVTGNASTATALASAVTIGGTSFDGTGNIAVAVSTLATNVDVVANNSNNETTYLGFVDGVSGSQSIETDTGLTYNPSTGVLTSTTFSGAVSGLASTATLATNVNVIANNANNETTYLGFVDGATGSQSIETDTGLTYNPSTGVITATQFTGAVVGNVTGNASGTAATVTGANQASITGAANLVTVGALDAGSITSGFGTINTGSSDITTTGTVRTGGLRLTSDITSTATQSWNILDNSASAVSFDTGGKAGILKIVTSDGAEAVTMSGNLTVSGNATVDGDLTVSGNTVTVNTATLNVEDPLIILASGNTSADSVDVGIVAKYNDGTNRYRGMFWDATAGQERWKFFTESTEDLSTATTVNTGATGYAAANIEAANIYGTIATVAQGSITSLGTLTALQVDQININGNSITSTDSNGAIYIAPNGTGTAYLRGNFEIDQSGHKLIINNDTGIPAQSSNRATMAAADYAAGDARFYIVTEAGNQLILGNGEVRWNTTGKIATGSGALTLDPADNVHITNNQGLGIGHTAMINFNDGKANVVTAELQVLGTAVRDGSLGLAVFNSTNQTQSVAPILSMLKSAHGTIGSSSIVADDEVLGTILWNGDDGQDYLSAAAGIMGVVDGTPGANDMPGRLVFLTSADGSGQPSERMRIDSAGNLTFAQTTTISTSTGVLTIDGDDGIVLQTTGSGGVVINEDVSIGVAVDASYNLRVYDDKNSKTAVWIQNPNTGTSANTELLIGQASGDKVLKLGSSYNYSSADWNNAWVWGDGRDLALKSDSDVVIYAGGTAAANIAMSVDSTGVIGIGRASNADRHMFIEKDFGEVDASKYGMVVRPVMAETDGASTNILTGIESQPYISGASFSVANTQNWTATVGVRAIVAYPVSDGASAAGTITGVAGFMSRNGSRHGSGGVWTNQYGMYIENLTTATNNYAIWTQGATPSYFGGYVGIGIAAPEALLHVSGTSNGALLDVLKIDNSGGSAATEVGLVFENGADLSARISAAHSSSDKADLKFWTATAQNTLTLAMIIDDAGKMVIGHTTASGVRDVWDNTPTPELQVVGTTSPSIAIIANNATSTTGALSRAGSLVFVRSLSNTLGSTTLVTDDIGLGGMSWVGADGNNYYSQAASITAFVDGTSGATDMPGRLVFSTTGDGGDGSVERMRINSAGNVGIGTTNPFVGLSVENSSLMVATSHDTINSTIVWANPGVYREGVYISYDATNDKGRIASVRPNVGYSDLSLVGTNLYLNTSTGSGTTAATRVTILAAGNVGIGTTSPHSSAALHIERDYTGYADIRIHNTNIANNTNGARLLFVMNDKGGGAEVGGIYTHFYDHTSSDSSNAEKMDMSFNLVHNNATAERLRIKSDGNVGIGKTTPREKLDVHGNIAVNNEITFEPESDSDTGTGYINFHGYLGSTTRFRDLYIGNGKGANVAYVDGSTGYVGIGATVPATTLHVNASGGAGLRLTRDAQAGYLNFDVDGTNAHISNPRSDGTIKFKVNGDNERMRIDGTKVSILSSMSLIIGHTAIVPMRTDSPALSLLGLNDNSTTLGIGRFSDDTDSGEIYFAKSRGTSIGSFTIVDDNDTLGSIRAMAGDGGDFDTLSAQIKFTVDDATPVAGTVGGDIQFYTVPSPEAGGSAGTRMVIAGSGKVGIGNDAPVALLDVKATAVSTVPFQVTDHDSANPEVKIALQGDGRPWLQIYQNNTEKIRLDGGSDSFVTGNWSCLALTETSDSRLKSNVQTIPSALTKVSQMRGVSFDRLDIEKSSSGVIAQEIELIAPEAVSIVVGTRVINEGESDEETLSDVKGVNYSSIIGYLIEAIKELKAEVDALKN